MAQLQFYSEAQRKMEESEGDEGSSSDDSEYQERLARMRDFANQQTQGQSQSRSHIQSQSQSQTKKSQSRASSRMGRGKVACFEMICQRNNKVQEQKMFFFEKVSRK